MRTAEQIIKDRFLFYNPDVYGKDVELSGETVSELINEARIEAIKECAELCSETEDNRWDHHNTILQLINEVK